MAVDTVNTHSNPLWTYGKHTISFSLAGAALGGALDTIFLATEYEILGRYEYDKSWIHEMTKIDPKDICYWTVIGAIAGGSLGLFVDVPLAAFTLASRSWKWQKN